MNPEIGKSITPDYKVVDFSYIQTGDLAHFIASLERNGLAYEIINLVGGWKVRILGLK